MSWPRFSLILFFTKPLFAISSFLTLIIQPLSSAPPAWLLYIISFYHLSLSLHDTFSSVSPAFPFHTKPVIIKIPPCLFCCVSSLHAFTSPFLLLRSDLLVSTRNNTLNNQRSFSFHPSWRYWSRCGFRYKTASLISLRSCSLCFLGRKHAILQSTFFLFINLRFLRLCKSSSRQKIFTL